MIRKRTLGGAAMALLVLCVICFQGCMNSPKFSSRPVRVGFLIHSFKAQRWVKDTTYFGQKIRTLGASVIIKGAGNSPGKQLEQARQLLDEGVDVLVISAANVFQAAGIVREAQRRGVPVLAYERLIRNCSPDFYVSFDGVEVGRQMAKYALSRVPKGRYILLWGDRHDQNAEFIRQGQLEVLTSMVKEGKVEIAYKGYMEDWSGSEGKNALEQYLKFYGEEPFDVLLASSDNFSVACVPVLKKYPWGKNVVVTGTDATLTGCQAIDQGNQNMTVYKPIRTLAERGAEIAVQLANGESPTENPSKMFNGRVEVPSQLFDPVVVDKERLKEVIVGEGFWKAEEIFEY